MVHHHDEQVQFGVSSVKWCSTCLWDKMNSRELKSHTKGNAKHFSQDLLWRPLHIRELKKALNNTSEQYNLQLFTARDKQTNKQTRNGTVKKWLLPPFTVSFVHLLQSSVCFSLLWSILNYILTAVIGISMKLLIKDALKQAKCCFFQIDASEWDYI